MFFLFFLILSQPDLSKTGSNTNPVDGNTPSLTTDERFEAKLPPQRPQVTPRRPRPDPQESLNKICNFFQTLLGVLGGSGGSVWASGGPVWLRNAHRWSSWAYSRRPFSCSGQFWTGQPWTRSKNIKKSRNTASSGLDLVEFRRGEAREKWV